MPTTKYTRPTPTASQTWQRLVDEKMASNGGDHVRAALAVDRENPSLREQMLAEANPRG